MSARLQGRLVAFGLLSALLAGSCALAARAASPPVPGGSVPSVLSLSLAEPSDFSLVRATRGENVYGTTVRAEVTATEAPVELTVVDGRYRQLEGEVFPPVRRWTEPVTRAVAKVRLRRRAPSARALRNRQELLLFTLTAGGP